MGGGGGAAGWLDVTPEDEVARELTAPPEGCSQ
jgi:hypothetical protein